MNFTTSQLTDQIEEIERIVKPIRAALLQDTQIAVNRPAAEKRLRTLEQAAQTIRWVRDGEEGR